METQNLTYPAALDQILLMEKPAVVIIDMQTFYMEGIPHIDTIVENQQRVIRQCLRQGLPMAVLEYGGESKTVTELVSLVDLSSFKGYFTKVCDDGFTNFDFVFHLGLWKRMSILFMGVDAGYCVLDTAKSAYNWGYDVLSAECLIGGNVDKARPWFLEKGRYLVK